METEKIRQLIEISIAGLENSYAPYSKFRVSAALLCSDGSIYSGCNIENAAYSATVCAERTAFFNAVKEGKREFTAISVCGGQEGRITEYCAPCGVCRQVMREFCRPEEFLVILPKNVEDYKVYTLAQLLPESFGPDNLGVK